MDAQPRPSSSKRIGNALEPSGKKRRRQTSVAGGEDSNGEVVPVGESDYAASGLKNTTHGVIYQVKLLLLFLKRGFDRKYLFKLATDLDAGEKFDDVVLQYKRNDSTDATNQFVFLQAKHKQDETLSISATDLLNVTGGEFSLLKYFISFLKIKQRPEYRDAKQFVICTNINIAKDLESSFEQATIEDDILLVGLNSRRLRLMPDKFPRGQELICTLKNSSDQCSLARKLAEHVADNKKLTLLDPLFKMYHGALVTQVLDVHLKRFRPSFCDLGVHSNSTNGQAKVFHDLFIQELSKLSTRTVRLESVLLDVSKGFMTKVFEEPLTLPSDQVTDNDIAEFFTQLSFAVNQPNEELLGECIKNELGLEFNLHDANFPYTNLLTEVLNNMKAKQGKFLTHADAGRLFSEVGQKVAKFIAIGATELFRLKLKESCLEFREDGFLLGRISDFLCDPGHGRLHVIVPENCRLGSVGVDQALDLAKLYEARDSHVFVTADDFLRLGELKRACQSDSCLALVIECSPPVAETLTAELRNILNEGKPQKVLVVSEGFHFPEFGVEDELRCGCGDIKFCDLTLESQRKLTTRAQAILQGKEVGLGTLLSGDIGLADFIDARVLSTLISDQPKLEVGRPLEWKHDDYYIKRSFEYRTKVLRRFQTESSLFLASLKPDGRAPEAGHDVVMISDNPTDYERIRQRHRDHTVHWLRQESDDRFDWLVWQSSSASLSKLRPLMNRGLSGVTTYREDELARQNVVIITAEPGMGKSTILSQLASQFQQNDSSSRFWIAQISLPNFSTELKALGREASVEDTHKFLQRVCLGPQPSDLERSWFRYFLSRSRVAFFFDAFDEISPDYKEKVVHILKVLKNSQCHKLFVSTRPYGILHMLEDELSIFSCSMQPLPKADQQRFLISRFSKGKPSLSKPSEEFAAELLNMLSSRISDRQGSFTSIPLHLRMLATVFDSQFQSYCGTCSMSDPEGMQLTDIINENFNLGSMYHKFFEIKFVEGYLPKSTGFCDDLDKPQSELMLDLLRKHFLQDHKVLALLALFGKHGLGKLVSEQEAEKQAKQSLERIQKAQEKFGIVDRVAGGKPVFVHQTYAEYFAALWLTESYSRENVLCFLRENIFLSENEMLRRFFDCLLCTIPPDGALFPLHVAFLNNDDAKVKALLEVPSHERTVLDMGGRSVLHLAVAYGDEETVRTILDYVSASELSSLIGTKDSVFGWSPLTYADYRLLWRLAELLLQKGGNGKDMHRALDTGKDRIVNDRQENLLHICAKEGYLELAKLLLQEKVASLTDKEKDGKAALHLAAQEGRLKLVTHFVALEEAISQGHPRDTKGRLPVHLAAERGQLEVVTYFFETLNVDPNAEDDNGASPLHYAAGSGHLDVVSYLREKGAKLDKIADSKLTPLHLAAGSGHLDTVVYCVESGADFYVVDDDTPLHWAALSGRFEIAKYFIDHCNISCDIRQYDGSTPLHLAATNNHLKLVKYLVDTKHANCLAQDNDGRVPLHKAAQSGKLEASDFLCRRTAGGSLMRDKKGNTPLLLAANMGGIDLLDLLIDTYNADVNGTNDKGESPLHIAAKSFSDVDKTVQYLIEKRDLDFRVRDRKNRNALDLAARNGSSDVLGYLLVRDPVVLEAALFDSSILMPVLYAALNEKLEAVTSLLIAMHELDGGVRLNQFLGVDASDVVDKLNEVMCTQIVSLLISSPNFSFAAKSRSLLKEAIRGDNEQTVRLISGMPCDLLALDEKGNTPLMYAAKLGKQNAISILLSHAVITENINAQSAQLQTALHFAAFKGHEGVVSLLLAKYNVDASLKDTRGRTALHAAAEERNWEVVTLLVESGTNVNVANLDGETALHRAAGDENLSIVQLLIEHGADIRMTDKQGNTALHEAALGGELEIIEFLIAKGADLNVTNINEFTAFDLASQENKTRAVQYLLEMMHTSEHDQSVKVETESG